VELSSFGHLEHKPISARELSIGLDPLGPKSPCQAAAINAHQAVCILRGRPRLRRRPFFGGRPTLLCKVALTAIVRAFETGANSTITLPSDEMIILSIINPACCTPLIRSETFISFSLWSG